MYSVKVHLISRDISVSIPSSKTESSPLTSSKDSLRLRQFFRLLVIVVMQGCGAIPIFPVVYPFRVGAIKEAGEHGKMIIVTDPYDLLH